MSHNLPGINRLTTDDTPHQESPVVSTGAGRS